MSSNGDASAEHSESVSMGSTYAHDLFIIHAAADDEFVRGYLVPALDLPRDRVLLVDELALGGVLVSEIDDAVSRSRFIVPVLSPAYLASRFSVYGEQLASDLSTEQVRVIPLRLIDCALPRRLVFRISLDFTDRARWADEAARLRKLLQVPAPVARPIECPYPGIHPFVEQDARRFFGRDAEIDDLIGRLDRGEREVYVIGPSGSGKSSLVRAGLLHRLEAGSSRLGQAFVVRTMRPGKQPAGRLAKLLDGDLADPGAAIESFVSRHVPATRVLVFVDQLEELFTLASPAEQHRFIEALGRLRPVPQCCLVLALRADFLGELLDSGLGPHFADRIVPRLVAPLRGAALARAIREPALQEGVHVEARLCDRLVADAADEPGALPLVQETLRVLWDRRQGLLIGLDAYEALGNGGRGLDVAIARRADTAMSALTLVQQLIARQVLLRLVSFGEGRPDTRRQQEVAAIRASIDDARELPAVLQHLVEHRLITVDGSGPDGAAVADLSHEALITAWPALRAWIAPRRAAEQARRRHEAKLGEWIERGRGQASLLDAVELSEVEQWLQSDAPREVGYDAELRALVAASRREVEKLERIRQDSRALESLAQRRLAMTHMEHGRVLLFDGRPLEALPYLVAARSEGIDSPGLRMLFAQASRHVPLVTLIGHAAAVWTADLSGDGRRIVTASYDGTARVWDSTTGEPVTPPLEHRGSVGMAAFSPDGTRVVTTSRDQTARIWDAATGAPLTAPLQHDHWVTDALFSSDGAWLMTRSLRKTVCVWDARTGTLAAGPVKHEHDIAAMAFRGEHAIVITASEWDARARVWQIGARSSISLKHREGVTVAAFSADGARVITASKDNSARVWDSLTGKPLTPRLEHLTQLTAMRFSADGKRVAIVCDNNTVRVWDAATAKLIPGLMPDAAGAATPVLSADGARLVTLGDARTAWVYEIATGQAAVGPLQHARDVTMAAFNSDGTRVITACEDGKARIWDAAVPAAPTQLRHDSLVVEATFSADGARVVTASDDQTARVWDAVTGEPVTRPLEHPAQVFTAAFSADGTRVVTTSGDGIARIWDAASGRLVAVPLDPAGVMRATFNHDGTRVITADDHDAQTWDAMTGAPTGVRFRHAGAVTAAAFSGDGARVVTASEDGTARIWDATTATPLTAPLRHRAALTGAAFSADGTRLVTASKDGAARIWDAATGAPIGISLEHHDIVVAAAFSRDGTRVVTASEDMTARVWDAATGQPVTSPLGHRRKVTAAAFSSDGACVVTVSHGAVRVWDAATGTQVVEPLAYPDGIDGAAFSADGTRVVTASGMAARIWTLPRDTASLDHWRLIARCSPFALHGDALTTNHEPLAMRPVASARSDDSAPTPEPPTS